MRCLGFDRGWAIFCLFNWNRYTSFGVGLALVVRFCIRGRKKSTKRDLSNGLTTIDWILFAVGRVKNGAIKIWFLASKEIENTSIQVQRTWRGCIYEKKWWTCHDRLLPLNLVLFSSSTNFCGEFCQWVRFGGPLTIDLIEGTVIVVEVEKVKQIKRHFPRPEMIM